MSLATVQMATPVWDDIFNHLGAHRPKYGNMHMREACVVNNKRSLRYLHMMVAPAKNVIEGMISGPNIFCHYKLVKNKYGNIQVNVLSETGSVKEKQRLAKRFQTEILNRIAEEQAAGTTPPHPRYSKGQFYLRRKLPGMNANHANCKAALNARALDAVFLQMLSQWNFELLHP